MVALYKATVIKIQIQNKYFSCSKTDLIMKYDKNIYF